MRRIHQHVKIGMTAGESLKAMVAAMEEVGYIFMLWRHSGETGIMW